ALAGGQDVGSAPGERSRARPWEELAALAPEVVVVALCGFDIPRAQAELGAVTDGAARTLLGRRVEFLDGNAYTSRPGPRLVDAAETLARAGFDVVSTANNYAWDGGPAGVEETMRQLTRAGVRFVGSGFGRDMAEQPVILERRGWRVAFFALTRAWNPAPYTFHSH